MHCGRQIVSRGLRSNQPYDFPTLSVIQWADIEQPFTAPLGFPFYRPSDYDAAAPPHPASSPIVSPSTESGYLEFIQDTMGPSGMLGISRSKQTNAMPGSFSHYQPPRLHAQEAFHRNELPSLLSLPQTLRDNITAGQRLTKMRTKLTELGFNPRDFGTQIVVERVLARNEGESTEELVAKCVAQLV